MDKFYYVMASLGSDHHAISESIGVPLGKVRKKNDFPDVISYSLGWPKKLTEEQVVFLKLKYRYLVVRSADEFVDEN